MTVWNDFLASRGATFDDGLPSGFGAPGVELAAAQAEAVVCDLGRWAIIEVGGVDAEAFLQGQFTNDVQALAAGSSQFSAWCSAKGRILANFLLLRRERAAADTATFSIVLPRAMGDTVVKRLRMFVLRSKVTIVDRSEHLVPIGVGGPGATEAVRSVFAIAPAVHRIAEIEGGFLLALPGSRYVVGAAPEAAAALWTRLERVARPAGFGVWQWLTVHAGVPIITPATTDLFVPQMANLDALDAISFQKGCYAGQEIVARTQYLGRLKERTFLLHAAGAVPAAGERLYSTAFDDQPCGTVVAAAAAPGGGSDVLAVLQLVAAESGDVRLGAPDGPLLKLLQLPYALPVAAAPRSRMA